MESPSTNDEIDYVDFNKGMDTVGEQSHHIVDIHLTIFSSAICVLRHQITPSCWSSISRSGLSYKPTVSTELGLPKLTAGANHYRSKSFLASAKDFIGARFPRR